MRSIVCLFPGWPNGLEGAAEADKDAENETEREPPPSHKEAKNNQNVARQLSCHKINMAKPFLSLMPVSLTRPIRDSCHDRWISTQNNKMHN